MAKVTMTITLDEDFVEPVKEAILAARPVFTTKPVAIGSK